MDKGRTLMYIREILNKVEQANKYCKQDYEFNGYTLQALKSPCFTGEMCFSVKVYYDTELVFSMHCRTNRHVSITGIINILEGALVW